VRQRRSIKIGMYYLWSYHSYHTYHRYHRHHSSALACTSGEWSRAVFCFSRHQHCIHQLRDGCRIQHRGVSAKRPTNTKATCSLCSNKPNQRVRTLVGGTIKTLGPTAQQQLHHHTNQAVIDEMNGESFLMVQIYIQGPQQCPRSDISSL
jgi:hypothetical protein